MSSSNKRPSIREQSLSTVNNLKNNNNNSSGSTHHDDLNCDSQLLTTFVNEVLLVQLKKWSDQWTQVCIEGNELLSSMCSLVIESQYCESPYWGVLTHQKPMRTLLSRKLFQQKSSGMTDLNQMVHLTLKTMLNQLTDCIHQCEQNRVKWIQSFMNKELLKNKTRMQELTELSSSCESMIRQMKAIRSTFENDWNMKAMIVSEVKLLVTRGHNCIDNEEPTSTKNVDNKEAISGSGMTTSSDSGVLVSNSGEEDDDLPPLSQQRLIFFVQSWKLQPYISQELSHCMSELKKLIL